MPRFFGIWRSAPAAACCRSMPLHRTGCVTCWRRSRFTPSVVRSCCASSAAIHLAPLHCWSIWAGGTADCVGIAASDAANARRPARAPLATSAVLVRSQDLDHRRRQQNLAEGVHPASRVLVRTDAALTELIELVEAVQLQLKLKRRA